MPGQDPVRAAARWALQALARTLQDRFPGLGRRLSSAARLCAELDVSQPELVEVAVMAGALGAGQLPTLPREAEELLALSREHWDGSGPRGLQGEEISPEARVVALVLATDERQPGRFDPFLLESLAEHRTGGSRRLLRMGKAALESGELDLGSQSLQGVARDPESAWEGVEALLTLARVNRREARQLLAAALETARRLGPSTAARTELEAGLLLLDLALPEALALLQEAALRLEDLALPAQAARARLALAQLTPQAGDDVPGWVEVLRRPGNEPELLASAPWLFPLALEYNVCDEALAFLIGNQPRELGVQLERVSPSARVRGARALSGWSGLFPHREILERLAADARPEVRAAAEASLAAPARSEPPWLRIRSFGALQVWVGDRHWGDASWGSRPARYLFAYLVAHPGLVSAEQLREDFRLDLGEAIAFLESSTGLLVREDGSLGLRSDLPRWSDLEEFERADRDSLEGCRRMAELAMAPYLEGCRMDWAVARRARLEAALSQALVRLGRHGLQEGDPGLALEFALRLTRNDALSQPACLLAMEAQLAMGHPDEAVRAYELCRARVGGELGVELVAAFHRAKLHL